MEYDDLPIPRLELRYEDLQKNEKGQDQWRWYYELIYKHVTGEIVHVEMGGTDVKGTRRHGVTEPFRDSVHIRHDLDHLGLRAFRVFGDEIVELDKDTPYM